MKIAPETALKLTFNDKMKVSFRSSSSCVAHLPSTSGCILHLILQSAPDSAVSMWMIS